MNSAKLYSHLSFIFMLFYLVLQPVMADYTDVFPTPIPGWKAGKVTVEIKQVKDILTQSFEELLSGRPVERRILKREYQNEKGHGITIIFDTHDCYGATLIENFPKDPKLAKPGSRLITFKGLPGLDYPLDNGGRMVTLDVEGCLLVTVGGSNSHIREIETYLELIDFDRIKNISK